MQIILRQKPLFIILTLFLMTITVFACGKKTNPIPQKTNQLFSFQDVYAYLNEVGTITIVGNISGMVENVQAIELELEGFDENCPTCPFIPAEKFSLTPIDQRTKEISRSFSYTVFPTKQFKSYRWRLVGYNGIAGLPNIMTTVKILEAPIDDDREFIEIPMDKE